MSAAPNIADYFGKNASVRKDGIVRFKGKVHFSPEFQRIKNLPRRKLDLESVTDLTPMFATSGECELWPIQSAMLVEAHEADGLFAVVDVGGGKTLATLLLPHALDSNNTVLLVPTQLKRKTRIEIDRFYAKHFDIPQNKITIISYEQLSSARSAQILDRIRPDLIICDEAHKLRHKTAARTKRFLRYAKENPSTRFAFLSGTITNRSIKDYAHLLELALRKNSPLPNKYTDLVAWADALDVKKGEDEARTSPGVLRKLCKPGESVREGFQRRLAETPGVVVLQSPTNCGASLHVRQVPADLPPVLAQQLKELKETWCIGEEEIADPLAYWRAQRQLACGFYYVWDWPNGVKDQEWLDIRAGWNREVREILKLNRRGMDSPLQVANAAERGVWQSEYLEEWKRVRVRYNPKPPTQTIWVDKGVLKNAVEWAEKQDKPSIIWYEWEAAGAEIARMGNYPLYGEGTDASEATEKVIVCSMRTQGEGKNLQHVYANNLLIAPPSNGTLFEQVVGRTHRPGQKEDEVIVDWFGHTEAMRRAMDGIIQDAKYKLQTLGQRQKALYATHLDLTKQSR